MSLKTLLMSTLRGDPQRSASRGEYVAAGVKLPAILPVGGDMKLAIRAG